jgi:uncharacterized membrane protein
MISVRTHPRRRRIAAIAAAGVVAASLAVADAAPAPTQAPPSPPPTEVCTPGRMVDFCIDVWPTRAFLLDNGAYTTFAVPGAVLTTIFRINNRGQMVGTYVDAGGGTPGGFTHGFLLEDGVFTTIDVPGPAGPLETEILGINNRGQILGGFVDAGGVRRSFLLDRGGFTVFAFPGASLTAAFDINDRGQIVGFYVDAVGPGHGFLLDRGTFTTIDTPSDSGPRPTQVVGINNRGQMVGLYMTAEGIVQGFLMDKRGVVTSIDHPDAVMSPGQSGTAPLAINERGGIVGVFDPQ